MPPTDETRVCTVAEAVQHLEDRRPRKVRQAEARCGVAVMCRCNIRSCCVCVYVKAQGLCHFVTEARPCNA